MSLLTDCCWCNSTMWFTTGHWLSAVSKVFLASSWDVYNNHWALSDKRKLILLGPVKCYCKWPIPWWLQMPQNCDDNACPLFSIRPQLPWSLVWGMAEHKVRHFNVARRSINKLKGLTEKDEKTLLWETSAHLAKQKNMLQMWVLKRMKMLIMLLERSDSINSVKTRQLQEITGNLSHHYIFPDSLINSNYFFHYSPVHSPNS